MGLFAQVAAGAGRGMVANVEDNREDAKNQADRDHSETLLRMRELSSDKRQEDSQAHDFDKYDKSRTDTLEDLGNQREYDEGIAATTREQDVTDAATKQRYELELQDRKNSGAISLQDAKDRPDKYQSVKVKINEYLDGSPLPVEREIPLTYDKTTGRYLQERGGELMSYALLENLPEDQKNLASNPLDAMAWAQANGGAESLPAWFKVQHKGAYEAVKREYEKTEDVGGNKESGALSEGAAARDSIAPIEIPPARSPEGLAQKAPGWGGDFSNYERTKENVMTLENAGEIAQSIANFMMSPSDEMFGKK